MHFALCIVFPPTTMLQAIAESERVKIVSLHLQGKSVRAIADALQLSSGAVQRWVDRWRNGQDITEKPRSGRPHALTKQASQFTRKLLKQPGFGGLDRATRALHNKGLTTRRVHKSTLSRMLRGDDMTTPTQLVPDRSAPARALSAADMKSRLEFAKANKSRDWDNVMFTDRARFYHKYPGCKVPRVQWVGKGERRMACRPNNPRCVNVYMGITKYGATKPVIVTGTSKQQSSFTTRAGKPAKHITAAEYGVVLRNHLLREGSVLMQRHGIREWVFQQDNDPSQVCCYCDCSLQQEAQHKHQVAAQLASPQP